MLDEMKSYFEKVRQLTTFTDQSKMLVISRPLFAPMRIFNGVGLPVGIYDLFDRQVATAGWGAAQGWGSNAGGALVNDYDIPRWFILQNRVMPKDRYYVARYLSIQWRYFQIGGGAMPATYASDRMVVQNNPTFLEIRPGDKDVEMKIPLDFIGDYTINQVREVGAPLAANISSVDHYKFDQNGGKYPLYPDDQTPGILFESDYLMNITLHNELAIAGGSLANEIQMLFVFDGWLYSRL